MPTSGMSALKKEIEAAHRWARIHRLIVMMTAGFCAALATCRARCASTPVLRCYLSMLAGPDSQTPHGRTWAAGRVRLPLLCCVRLAAHPAATFLRLLLPCLQPDDSRQPLALGSSSSSSKALRQIPLSW